MKTFWRSAYFIEGKVEKVNSYAVDDFPSVFLTADIIVLKYTPESKKQILLIQRLKDPFKNSWALPGGFFDVHHDEDVYDAAVRELFEETNLSIQKSELKLVGVFSKRGRDPRELIATKPCRIISTAFVTQINENRKTKAKDDALAVAWYAADELPDLAFDHADMIKLALG
jgi:8-oxo-dGTP diphosphatase